MILKSNTEDMKSATVHRKNKKPGNKKAAIRKQITYDSVLQLPDRNEQNILIMKRLIYCLIILALMSGCRNGKSPEAQRGNNAVQSAAESTNTIEGASVRDVESSISVKGLADSYLKLKNALAGDDSEAASLEGINLKEAFERYDKTALAPDHVKLFEGIADDAMEHADHIGQSNGDISHQRQHFELLSNGMYDLITTFDAGLVLYRQFCPMYNDGKGAYWLNESKKIQNPYYGSEMPQCGSVKEIIQ